MDKSIKLELFKAQLKDALAYREYYNEKIQANESLVEVLNDTIKELEDSK